MYEVSDPSQLPFAAQCMVDNAKVAVVVAIGFLVADSHWCSQQVRRQRVEKRNSTLPRKCRRICVCVFFFLCGGNGGRFVLSRG